MPCKLCAGVEGGEPSECMHASVSVHMHTCVGTPLGSLQRAGAGAPRGSPKQPRGGGEVAPHDAGCGFQQQPLQRAAQLMHAGAAARRRVQGRQLLATTILLQGARGAGHVYMHGQPD